MTDDKRKPARGLKKLIGKLRKPVSPVLGRSATDEDYRKRSGWTISVGPLKGATTNQQGEREVPQEDKPEDGGQPELPAEGMRANKYYRGLAKPDDPIYSSGIVIGRQQALPQPAALPEEDARPTSGKKG